MIAARSLFRYISRIATSFFDVDFESQLVTERFAADRRVAIRIRTHRSAFFVIVAVSESGYSRKIIAAVSRDALNAIVAAIPTGEAPERWSRRNFTIRRARTAPTLRQLRHFRD